MIADTRYIVEYANMRICEYVSVLAERDQAQRQPRRAHNDTRYGGTYEVTSPNQHAFPLFSLSRLDDYPPWVNCCCAHERIHTLSLAKTEAKAEAKTHERRGTRKRTNTQEREREMPLFYATYELLPDKRPTCLTLFAGTPDHHESRSG